MKRFLFLISAALVLSSAMQTLAADGAGGAPATANSSWFQSWFRRSADSPAADQKAAPAVQAPDAEARSESDGGIFESNPVSVGATVPTESAALTAAVVSHGSVSVDTTGGAGGQGGPGSDVGALSEAASVASHPTDAPQKHTSELAAAQAFAQTVISSEFCQVVSFQDGAFTVQEGEDQKITIAASDAPFAADVSDLTAEQKELIRTAVQRMRVRVICKQLGVQPDFEQGKLEYDGRRVGIPPAFLSTVYSDQWYVINPIVAACARYVGPRIEGEVHAELRPRRLALGAVTLTAVGALGRIIWDATRVPDVVPPAVAGVGVCVAHKKCSERINKREEEFRAKKLSSINPLIAAHIQGQPRDYNSITDLLNAMNPSVPSTRKPEVWDTNEAQMVAAAGVALTGGAAPQDLALADEADGAAGKLDAGAALDSSSEVSGIHSEASGSMGSAVMVNLGDSVETNMRYGPTNPRPDVRGKKNKAARDAWRQERAAAGDKRFIDYLAKQAESMTASSASSVGGSAENA